MLHYFLRLHNTAVPENYNVNKNFSNKNNVITKGAVPDDKRNAHFCDSLARYLTTDKS
jgi:hypothetical protein